MFYNQEKSLEAVLEKLVFTTIITPRSMPDSVLFFESLREFGGELADAPFIALTPNQAGEFPKEIEERFKALKIERLPFEMDEEAFKFPFAGLVYAAAKAESLLQREAETLVWLLSDTLVVNPPTAFYLPKGIRLAYRPVHHTLIGSIYDQPLDEFWSLVYKHCHVPEESVFPMETCVGDNIIRPYFNAGMLVVRPQVGLLTTWWDRFEALYRHPDFTPFYERDERYAIFIHQAVLAGVVLVLLDTGEMVELPPTVNYPLNLHHSEMPPALQPAALNDLVTCRTEGKDTLRETLKGLEVREPLKGWLVEKLAAS
jgi:hypothetical protein